MKILLASLLMTGCGGKSDNMKDLREIQNHTQERPSDPEVKERLYKEYQEKIRKESEDPDLPTYPNLKLTEAQLEQKRLGESCVTCDPNAEDPNMRPDKYKNF